MRNIITVDQQQKQLRILLAANEEPFGTKDHQCQIEAVPLDENTTFIRLHYLLRYSSFGYFKIKKLLLAF